MSDTPPRVPGTPGDQLTMVGLRQLHRDYYLAHAEMLQDVLESGSGGDRTAALAVFDDEAANLRSALDWSIEQGDPIARRLVLSMWTWFSARRLVREARAVGARAIACSPSEAYVAELLCRISDMEGDADEKSRILAQAVSLARGSGPPRALALALVSEGYHKMLMGHTNDGKARFEEALACADDATPSQLVAQTHWFLAYCHAAFGDVARGRAEFERAHAVLTESGSKRALARHFNSLSYYLLDNGLVDDALAASDQHIATAGELDDPAAVANGLRWRGMVLANQGLDAEAEAAFREALVVAPDEDVTLRALIWFGIAQLGTVFNRPELAEEAVSEGLAELDTLIEERPDDLEARCNLVRVGAEISELRGDLDGAKRALESLIALERGFGYRVHFNLTQLARFHARHGDMTTARKFDALTLDSLGDDTDPDQRVRRHFNAALLAAAEGDLAAAARHAELATETPRGEARAAHALLGACRFAAGDLDGAEAALRGGQALIPRGNPRSLRALEARVAVARGDTARARDLVRAGVSDFALVTNDVAALEILAGAAASEGRHDRALELLGAATAERERLRLPVQALAASFRQRVLDAIGDRLDAEARDAAEARGRALDPKLTIASEAQPPA